jgi:2-hydroxy-3-oxopropionate reductase
MKKIAFVGTGLMGLPMAKNLLKAGFSLKTYNRTIEKANPLKKYKAEIVKSIKEAVRETDVIITMLTDDEAVNAVMKNSDFLDNLRPGSTVIDMSSVKPETAKFHGTKLNSININYLDAPVSGGTIGAEEATLAIMVGGNEKVFNNHLDVLKILGNPTLVGPIASGQISKLANQIIVGLTIGAVAEAVSLCEKAGAAKFYKLTGNE